MYHRSAAGIDQPLPSDVRTPATLKVSWRLVRGNRFLTISYSVHSTICSTPSFKRNHLN